MIETAGRPWKMYVPRRDAQADVAGDRSYDSRADLAAIEAVGLNDHHRAMKSRLRTEGFGKMRPPDFTPVHLPPFPPKHLQLKRVQHRVEFGEFRLSVVDLVQTRGDVIVAVFRKIFAHGIGVELAPGLAELPGQPVGRLEQRIRERDCGLHALSITTFIPGFKER